MFAAPGRETRGVTETGAAGKINRRGQSSTETQTVMETKRSREN